MFIESPRRSIAPFRLPSVHAIERLKAVDRWLHRAERLYSWEVALLCCLLWLLLTEIIRVIGFGGFYGVPFALTAVVVAAWLAGLYSGLITAIFSVAMLYVLLPSMRVMHVEEESLWHLTVFSLAALTISGLAAAVRGQRLREGREKEMRDEFLAIVSHELRTPVTVISGSANLLSRLWERLSSVDRKDVLGSLQEESDRLTRMIEDLLLLARIEDGATPASEPLVLQPSLLRSIGSFRRLYPRRRIEVDMPEQRLVIAGNETYFDAVLRNVLSNAHRFSPIDEPVEVTAAAEDRRVVIRIRDHGPGVSKRLLDEIYEPYFHGQPISDGTRGIGLGLALCKRAMESMEGRISARTLDGGGLEVELSFRLADDVDG